MVSSLRQTIKPEVRPHVGVAALALESIFSSSEGSRMFSPPTGSFAAFVGGLAVPETCLVHLLAFAVGRVPARSAEHASRCSEPKPGLLQQCICSGTEGTLSTPPAPFWHHQALIPAFCHSSWHHALEPSAALTV